MAQVREAATRERETGEALQAKLATAAEREKEYATLLSKLARSVVHELNEECRLNAQLTGVSPKLVDVSRYSTSTIQCCNTHTRTLRCNEYGVTE